MTEVQAVKTVEELTCPKCGSKNTQFFSFRDLKGKSPLFRCNDCGRHFVKEDLVIFNGDDIISFAKSHKHSEEFWYEELKSKVVVPKDGYVVVDRKWLEELFNEVNENHHPVGTKSWLFQWQETRQRLLGEEAEEK